MMSTNRTYEHRRLIITEEFIFFAHGSKDQLLDCIPLYDVMSVDDMDGLLDENAAEKAKFHSLISVASTVAAFQVRTLPSGRNCGRKYCMQASSDSECAELINFISRVATKARQRRLLITQSYFQRSQVLLKKIYFSYWFQNFSAFLIISVLVRVVSLACYILY